jgi:predicted nuclease of restriction endonuclease-like RecB superfamily
MFVIKSQYGITKSKYKNVKIKIDGIQFDSKDEAEFYLMIKRFEHKGDTKLISVHPSVYMTAARILYKPDFLIEENGRKVYIDVKGFVTPEFALKLRLWRYYGAGTLRVVQRNKLEFQKIDEVTTVVGEAV